MDDEWILNPWLTQINDYFELMNDCWSGGSE